MFFCSTRTLERLEIECRRCANVHNCSSNDFELHARILAAQLLWWPHFRHLTSTRTIAQVKFRRPKESMDSWMDHHVPWSAHRCFCVGGYQSYIRSRLKAERCRQSYHCFGALWSRRWHSNALSSSMSQISKWLDFDTLADQIWAQSFLQRVRDFVRTKGTL